MRHLLILLAALVCAAAAPPPAKEIGAYRLTVPGGGVVPLYATADPGVAHPEVTRVVLVQHGLGRDAPGYFAAARKAQALAGGEGQRALMIAPQVLAEEDIAAHGLGADYLRWRWNDWAGGEPAVGPRPLSLFDVYDALLARLADRTRYPALREIVLAGHSAGGQIVQRYAVVGNGPDRLPQAGIAMRFVIANPSSYIWFTPDRPLPGGGFGPPPGTGACPRYADWRYGLTGHLPAYVTGTPASLEARYLARDVTYLLGTADTNPNHPQLDTSCAGETQGPTRYARGHNYVATLQWLTHGALRHSVHDVPGVAHNGGRMLTSACALAAMFDMPPCP